jgi:squamous cell carcinoma antigen recognized by T-cells 3
MRVVCISNEYKQYGTIFDVRWPSKKFKSTRRFCYVQFTSPVRPLLFCSGLLAVLNLLRVQNSAENALELHGHELEPNHGINVFISNPERKKERTDQDANEREVYVAGLSKFTTQADLEKLFKTVCQLFRIVSTISYLKFKYGSIKEVRMATDKDGSAKGFAFIEFEAEVNSIASSSVTSLKAFSLFRRMR